MEEWDHPSTTDFITNVVRLRPLRLHHHLPGIIKGQLTGDWLPAILHEGVHHWCFLTPLGQALTLQHLRARSLLLTSENVDSCIAEVTNALIRAHAIDSVLRPIAEGLSLLAELHGILDYTHRDHVSRVQWWTLWITCRHIPNSDKPNTFSAAFLEQAFSDVGVQRRVDILSNPFDSSLGGYLPGYLAMRALWRKAAASFSDELHAVGAFIAAVRFLIYYDPVLLELAIRTDVSDPDEISGRVIARLDQILQPDNLAQSWPRRMMFWGEGEVYTYKDLGAARTCEEEPDDGEAPRSIVYGDELTAAMLALGELFGRVNGLKAPASSLSWGGNSWLLRRRELFWLASEETSIRRVGDQLGIEIGEKWITLGGLGPGQEAPGDRFRGRVDVVFSLPDTWLVVMVSTSDGVLSVTPVIGRVFNELLLMVEGLDTIEHAEASLDQEAQSRLPQEWHARLQGLRQTAFRHADRWCAHVAFEGLSNKRIKSCIAALRLDGWAGVFRDDREALRSLALISTAVTLGPYRPEPKDLLLKNGIASKSLSRARAKLKMFGVDYLLQPQSDA